MRIKNLIIWFVVTVALGGVVSLPLGYVIEWVVGENLFTLYPDLLLSGLTFGSVAILGFFSYLIFNWLALGLLRNTKLFQIVQGALILAVFAQLVLQQRTSFQSESLWVQLAIPSLILLVSLLVAWWKVGETNRSAFIPTLFFMVVATIIEALPSLSSKVGTLPLPSVLLTVIVLLVCNAYQIGNLHRWVENPKKTGKKKEANQKRLAT